MLSMPAEATKTAVRVLVIPLEPDNEPYALIPLFGKYGVGKAAKVSLEDVARVRRYKWYVSPDGYVAAYVAQTYSKRTYRTIAMHRYVLGLTKGDGVLVDHERHDKLDNRRSKLRIATPTQNQANKRKHTARQYRSRYKGVTQEHEDTWRVKIGVEGELTALGTYPSEIEAALAYDKAARHYFGEFAYTNFKGTETASVEEILADLTQRRIAERGHDYRGVTHSEAEGWIAQIVVDGKRTYLGTYPSVEEAARVYDIAAST
jgi:hypothetical protein